MAGPPEKPSPGWLGDGESHRVQPLSLGGSDPLLEDGDLPIGNNHIENRTRPVALGRSNWLFAGSLRAGQRGAVIMSLIQSAKLNGHDPYLYLKDVLARHRCTPPIASRNCAPLGSAQSLVEVCSPDGYAAKAAATAWLRKGYRFEARLYPPNIISRSYVLHLPLKKF